MRRLTTSPGQAVDKKKRHSRAEIATKLAQANELVTEGKLQSEIARTLGVSVMTLHRWRKAPTGPQTAFVAAVSAIGRAADATELLSSSSKIHGCGD
jgi:transposase-like protein